MKRFPLSPYALLLPAFLWLIPCGTAAQQKQKTLRDLEGSWSGKLSLMGQSLKLDMNIYFGGTDSATVTFDSPDQGFLDLPTDRAGLYGDSLHVSLKPIGGLFTGRVNATSDTIRGFWHQGGQSFPLVMMPQGARTTLNRPQEPKPPFPYHVEDVRFPGPGGNFELAATLTRPSRPGLFPAVVLVTGSGAQNRDEELMGHKPFLVLADYLTRSGFAVLRYDDRGTGQSGGDFGSATTLDFSADAESALAFLRTRNDIDTTRTGILGHSEGGLVAAIVASRQPAVAFAVLMAAPGVTGEHILVQQAALIARAEGSDEKAVKENEKLSREIYTVLKKTTDNATASTRISKMFSDYSKKHEGEPGYATYTEAQARAQVAVLTSPWFRTFLVLNPETYLSAVKCPLLAITGSLDLQVPAAENLEAIEKALIFGGNSRYEIEQMPGLNHLFQEAVTGSPSEYGRIEETMSAKALEKIGTWMSKITGEK